VASTELAHAFATARYGRNAASVSGTVPDASGATGENAWSIWTDTITITGNIGNGQVIFGAGVTGRWSAYTTSSFTLIAEPGELAGVYLPGFATNYVRYGFSSSDIPGDVSDNVGVLYNFTYGVPFTLTGWLNLSGFINCLGFPGCDIDLSSDFSHTVTLNSVILPEGATLTSLSGTSYPIQDDSDGDGFPDDTDSCPTSSTSATVVIDGCDSRASNDLFSDGCKISDRIDACAASAITHNDFTACVTQLGTQLKRDGFITQSEKADIQKCAGKARIP
jgi:hypothetical protein